MSRRGSSSGRSGGSSRRTSIRGGSGRPDRPRPDRPDRPRPKPDDDDRRRPWWWKDRRDDHRGGSDNYYYYYSSYDPNYYVIPTNNQGERLVTQLTFAEEVYPNKSSMTRPADPLVTGSFVLTFTRDFSQASYQLMVSPTKGVPNTQVTAAHFHLGQRGENGPIIETLYDGAPQNGLVKSGFVLFSPVELYRLIKQGKIYVNVHGGGNNNVYGNGNVYADGMIRGQISA